MELEQIQREAQRCFHCKYPKCVEGCPIHMSIPEFIEAIKEGDLEKAYQIMKAKSYLGAICGRVCPHEEQCQGSCIRGIKEAPIAIGKLETFVNDWARENQIIDENKELVKKNRNNIKVAVIGSGPSGLTCSLELCKLGYDVTIFEKEASLGGILMYGIPEYRLPKKVVEGVIADIVSLGIQVKTKMCLGDNLTIEDLWKQGFRAIFLGFGNEFSKMLTIEGSHLKGVYGANEFLKEIDSIPFCNVAVIGGGNVAMDAARVAKNNGAKRVFVVYRRSKEKMPASKNEIKEAMEAGIEFEFLAKPSCIKGKDKVEGLEYKKTELIENQIVEIEDSEVSINIDTVVMAIGSIPNPKSVQGILLSEDGLVKITQDGETSLENVFAGGDLTNKKATVCMAIQSGKTAAIGIDKKLKS